jgi:hypothetical protein
MMSIQGLPYADIRNDHLSDPFVLVHVDRFGRIRDDHDGLLGVLGDVAERGDASEG